MDINQLATDLANKVNRALDICAPQKTFTIRPKYVQGLTDTPNMLMTDRDKTRSKLKSSSL